MPGALVLTYGDRASRLAVNAPKGRQSGRRKHLCRSGQLLALELYREEKVSLQRAAELCETPLAAFMDFVAQHGVPTLRYTFEDLQEESRSSDSLER